MLRASIMLVMAACAGCPRSDPAPGGGSEPTTIKTGAAAFAPSEKVTSAPAAAALPSEAMSWPSAVRAQEWAEAEAMLAKLPPAEEAKPEVRLARAHVARMLGKEAFAIALLDKLEDQLPLVRELIAKERALSELVAGPADRAAEWLATQPTPASWLLAAEAWDRAGEPARARAECERVLSAANRTRVQEEAARALRMRLVRDASDASGVQGAHASSNGDGATLLVDAKWLATNALDPDLSAAAVNVLSHLKPKAMLNADDLLARASVLAEAGHAEQALRTLEHAASAASTKSAKGSLSEVDRCRARAEVLYKLRTHYAEASLAYRACAALGGAHAAEDAFLSARALLRADRDSDALAAFALVIQRYPKTTWADQAQFHIARTHALAGRWQQAARAFDDYAQDWPQGHEKREADRYRALSHLLAQNHKVARRLLEDLAGSGDDPIVRARWTNLAALAAKRDGDRLHALSRWADVARSVPLTWPALVARARLTSEGAALPAAIEPAEATDAARLPAPLEMGLPPPVDMLHRIGLDDAAEQALRERESSVVAKAQGRSTEALCRTYAELDRAKRRFQLSFKVPATLLATAPSPMNLWAWDCAFPTPHHRHVESAAEAARIQADLLWAVMRQESAFDPEAASSARAVGLMQLMPATAKAVATTARLPHDETWLVRPEHNVSLGARYLRALLDTWGGNVTFAVGAYNAGSDAMMRWKGRAQGESLDVFVETIPFLETRGYIVRVMGNFARYGFLSRGEAGVPSIVLDMK
ncbi:MAG: transglycosylase SLT domain-containing protein [Polyangiaceae bacterium]|nr:transglycosylase SLT domain-containing protein [Polyangiaceae bacterium]